MTCDGLEPRLYRVNDLRVFERCGSHAARKTTVALDTLRLGTSLTEFGQPVVTGWLILRSSEM